MSNSVIGLLYDLSSDYKLKENDPKDLYAEMDNMKIVRDIKNALEENNYEVVLIGNFEMLLGRYKEYIQEIDLFFNLTEGLYGRNRESLTPNFLEHFEAKYVGADALSMGISMDKALTKNIFELNNIKTPKYFVSNKGQEGNLSFDFPMIVKPRWEGSSKGISKQAKVTDKKGLEERIGYIRSMYKQPAIIEEFIVGREFTVGVVGNDNLEVLPPLEIKIRGESVGDKMFLGRYVYTNDVMYECVQEEDLVVKLEEITRKVFSLLECRDFGRIDFRMNNDGELYVLEINPLPALSVQDAMSYAAEKVGWGYRGLIGKIISSAKVRYKI